MFWPPSDNANKKSRKLRELPPKLGFAGAFSYVSAEFSLFSGKPIFVLFVPLTGGQGRKIALGDARAALQGPGGIEVRTRVAATGSEKHGGEEGELSQMTVFLGRCQ